jgi:hypothetical protein
MNRANSEAAQQHAQPNEQTVHQISPPPFWHGIDSVPLL